ncbi:MAG: exosome complex protein Rrp42 [Nitrososphaerota archaeon]
MSFLPIKERSFAVRIMNDKIYKLLQQGKRIDERSPYDFRKITIQTNVVEKANGSALVSMGGTRILTGIKVELGTPYSDRPNEGIFSVNAELLPLASKSFEPGPPDERGIELARVVDRCIREGKSIDLERLCLVPGKMVYILYVDIYVLDYDGNYFDPSVMSAMAALATCTIPKYSATGERIEGEYMKVPIRDIPLSVTIGIIKDKLLVDPCSVEENSLDTSIVIGMDSTSNIVAMHKNSPGHIPLSLMESIINVAEEQIGKIRAQFMEAVRIGQEGR